MSLNSLPPPPEELRHLHRIHSLAVTTNGCDRHVQPSEQMVLNSCQQQQLLQQLPVLTNGCQLLQQVPVLANGCHLQQPVQPVVIGQQQQLPSAMNNYQQMQQANLKNNCPQPVTQLPLQAANFIMNNMPPQQLKQQLQQPGMMSNCQQPQLPNYPALQQQAQLNMVSNGQMPLPGSASNCQPAPPNAIANCQQPAIPAINGISMVQPRQPIREEIYPCGIPRVVFKPGTF
jgi:hypothetical protein